MATSGTVYSGKLKDSRFYVSWQQVKQSVDGNYTDIEWQAGLDNGNYWYSNAIKINNVKINGATVASNKTYSNITSSGKRQLIKGTKRISHNSNGGKSFTVSISGWLYEEGNTSGSSEYTLTTIPRATVPTLSAGSVALGGSVTINLPRASTSFYHEISYSIGKLSGQTAGVASRGTTDTSRKFTPPESLAAQLPKSTSGTVSIKVITRDSEEKAVGTKSIELKVTVPNNDTFKPAISSITLSEDNSDVTSKFGKIYVQNLSRLGIAISASAKHNAGITDYISTVGGVSYAGANVATRVLTVSGTVSLKVKVTDTRGYTKSSDEYSALPKSINVVPYDRPSVVVMQIRCDSAGNQTAEGAYLKITVIGRVSPVNNLNTKSLKFTWQASTDEKPQSKTVTPSAWEFEYSSIVSAPKIDETYVIEATLTDKVTSASAIDKTGIPVISRLAGGKGVTIGGEAKEEGFNVLMPSKFRDSVSLDNPLSLSSGGTGSTTGLANAEGGSYVRKAKDGQYLTSVSPATAMKEILGDTGWKELTLSTNWTQDTDAGNNKCRCRKVGPLVQIQFYVISRIATDTTDMWLIASGIPEECRPGYTMRSESARHNGASATMVVYNKSSADAGRVKIQTKLAKNYAAYGTIMYFV